MSTLNATRSKVSENWKQLILTLGSGFIGSLLFVALNLPLPWLIGALFTTTCAAVAGFGLWLPPWMRFYSSIIIGALFGTSVSPDFIGNAITWLPSMLGVILYVLIVTPPVLMYLTKVAKIDPLTAYLSAAPGGLLAMTLLGDSMGANARTITLMQSARVVLSVLIIPISFAVFTDYEPSGKAGTGGSFSALHWIDGLILVGASALGFLVARGLRIPIPNLMGPMIAVAALSINGLSSAEVPDSLVAMAQCIMGASIGTMFNKVKPKVVAATLFHGSVASVFMVMLAVIAAQLTQVVTGIPLYGLILAFAPGGFSEMSLVGFALGIDVTFVITHQLVRFFFVVLMVPLGLPLLSRLTRKIK